jgi:putative transcriptional regulator
VGAVELLDEMNPHTFTATILAVAVVGCSMAVPKERREPATRAWVLWGVQTDYITDPQILRPMESFSTKGECEIYQSALVKVQLERFDKLDRENRQRAMEGGTVVKGLRDKRGWTQGELAERAGVTQETVSNVESGKWPYSLSVAFDLSKALGVNVGELAKYDPHFPRNTVTQTKCWRDTVDPRGPKGK